MMLSIGGSVRAGKYLGECDTSAASAIFSKTLVCMVLYGVAAISLALAFEERLFAGLGASPELFGVASEYYRIIMPFLLAQLIVLALYYFIRLDGYPNLVATALTIGALVNILLDYLFIGLFGWGLTDAGPRLANLFLDGIAGEDLVTGPTRDAVAQLSRAVRSLPGQGSGDAFESGSVAFEVANRGDADLRVGHHADAGPDLADWGPLRHRVSSQGDVASRGLTPTDLSYRFGVREAGGDLYFAARVFDDEILASSDREPRLQDAVLVLADARPEPARPGKRAGRGMGVIMRSSATPPMPRSA